MLYAKFGFHLPLGQPKNVEFFFVCLFVRHAHLNAGSVRQMARVVLCEFYYLFPLKIIVRNCT